MLERPRLTARLAAASDTPVTVLVAPAGWGKTALLSDWVRRHGSAVWLSLEPGDGQDVFWTYLNRALSFPPAAGDDREPALTVMADEISRRRDPTTLILDDAHHLRDPGPWGGLDFLLRHANGRLRLLVSARETPPLPLPRRLLAGELAEIPATELAFTLDETRQLLSGWGLDLPAGHVGALHERTEGWPAGLRFEAAHAQGDSADAARFLRQEVLAMHPPELADALARASIGEHLSGGLVDELTCRDDGIALLDRLEHGCLFVVRVDHPPWTHRFHRMFGEVLRSGLHGRQPGLIPELHRRAARWHAAHELPAEALHHSLAANDAGLAGTIVLDRWPQLIMPHGGGRRPGSPHHIDDPLLALAHAADHLAGNDLGGANRLLRLAERLAERLRGTAPGSLPDITLDGLEDRFRLVTDAFHLAITRALGDTARVISVAPRLLAMMPQDDDTARAAVLAVQGNAQLIAGDTGGAIQTLREAAECAELSGLACQRLVATGALALAEADFGYLRRAETTAHRALQLPACPGRPGTEHRAEVRLALAQVELQRGDPAEALTHLRLAESTCPDRVQPGLEVLVAQAFAESLMDSGDLRAAHRALDDGYRVLEQAQVPNQTLRLRLAVTEAELHTFRGNPDAARTTLEPFDTNESAVAVAMARSYLRGGEAHAALRALTERQNEGPGLALEIGTLQALAEHRLGDHRRAAGTLERVLKLAEGQGFRRVFLRAGPDGRRLLTEQLDAGTAHWALIQGLVGAQPPSAGTPENPLSARELAVLRYLQGVLSNPEIASELCVSVNTVKTHVRSIYRKLRATSRRDAVKRARDLQLL